MVYEEVVRFYFNLGFSYDEIIASLLFNHNIVTSKRQLHRKLRGLGLYRRKDYSNILDIAYFIERELEKSGQLHGYRWMHLRCIQNGLTVTRETVRHLLGLLDPEGVQLRARKRLRRRTYRVRGPNSMWHVDSNDKLKPYGICINGCIDGFSRNMLWAESYSTNSDPHVIAHYFIQTVKRNYGCPVVIRADLGTENSTIRSMQHFFRHQQDAFAGANSFIQGSSQHNQRIECWWSVLRKHCLQFWMNMFEELKDNGDFSGDDLDKSLMQLCFMNLIQDDLDTTVKEWNSHRIAPSRNRYGPFGRPMVMYDMPQLYGTQNFLVPVQHDEVEVCETECTAKSPYPCDRDLFDLCTILMEESGLTAPSNPQEGRDLYLFLRHAIHQEL